MRRAAALGVIAALAGAASAHAQTLEGETLLASSTAQPGCDEGSCLEVTASCDPEGTSTLTFRVSGIAVGPYPGTFTASGRAELTGLAGPNVAFTEQFTIVSGETVITGTKELAPGAIPFIAGSGAGVCQESDAGFGYFDQAPAIYTATIDDPVTGRRRESGTTALNFTRSDVTECPAEPCGYGDFAEAFYTALPVACRPGWGFGDPNHCHSGPPGRGGR